MGIDNLKILLLQSRKYEININGDVSGSHN